MVAANRLIGAVMRLPIFCAALFVPAAVWAVTGEEFNPPPATPTTQTCDKGLIWDEGTKTCVAPQESRLDDATRLMAARELAYAGRIDEASAVLATVIDRNDDVAFALRGFLMRKSGNHAGAMRVYRAALSANPDNHLARSYMGQALAEAGDRQAAQDALSEIIRRGGRGTWPAVALREAIRSGRGPAY